MNESDKLKHLLHHWKEHNDEHAETYRQWSEKAAASGNAELSAVLSKITDETRKISGLFKDAERLL